MLGGLHRRIFGFVHAGFHRSARGWQQPRAYPGQTQKSEEQFHAVIMASAPLP